MVASWIPIGVFDFTPSSDPGKIVMIQGDAGFVLKPVISC
jgi:hypothetical protein